MSFFKKRTVIEPAWVFRAKGILWRVASAGSSMLVGEDRDTEKKLVTFFGLNRVSGTVLWKDVSFDEPWWISIEAIHRDRVFLHGYSRPDMPDHQRILALELSTGRTAWSRDDVRYMFASDDSVFTTQDTVTGRIVIELHLQTGDTLHSWGNDAPEVRTARARVSIQEEAEFPSPLADVLATDPRLDSVRKLSGTENLVGPVEVLVRDPLCLFSYHEKSAGGHLRNILRCINMQKGDQVFAETLNEDVQNPAADSFFVQNGLLYYVRERSMLTAVNLADMQ